MAEREELNRQYAYSAMSNMVTQADRSARRSRGGDGTGEVETLRGRTDIGRMGDALSGGKRGGGDAGDVTTNNKEMEEIRERANRKRMKREKASGAAPAGAAPGEAGKMKRSRRAGVEWSGGGGGILDMGEISGYRPTTIGATSNYEALLVSLCLLRIISSCYVVSAAGFYGCF